MSIIFDLKGVRFSFCLHFKAIRHLFDLAGGFLSAGRRLPAILEFFEMLKSSLCSVAKYSPPGGKFQKSEGHPVAGGETPFHQVSYCQIVYE